MNQDLKSKFNERYTLAEKYGWRLTEQPFSKEKLFYVTPPKHYECSKNQWEATFQRIKFPNYTIEIPHWFWEDEVLTTGTRFPLVRAVNCNIFQPSY